VYLNRKQNSRTAIASYYNNLGDIGKTIPIINKITQAVIDADEVKKFASALQNHEIEMSSVLETKTVKEALFEDFNGVIKSLGAWGGDFVMTVSKDNPKKYFKEKGYDIVIPYEDMIL
jgi:hypothetical protein